MNADLATLLPRYGIVPRGLIHVGANEGQELDAYVAAGFPALMLFEPLAAPHARLLARIAALPEGIDAVAHRVALGAAPGEAEMFVADNQAASSSLLSPMAGRRVWRKVRFTGRETVAVATLDSFTAGQSRYNVLVLDVQGFEVEVLRGGSATLAALDCIVCELNREATYHGSASVGDIDGLLAGAGFRRMETHWVSRSWGDGVYVRADRVPSGARPVEHDTKRPRGALRRWFHRLVGRA